MNSSPDRPHAMAGLLHTLLELAESRDSHFVGHAKAVQDLADRLAATLQLPDTVRRQIRAGAAVLDIGRIGLRDEVIKKPGPLTPAELKHLQSHVVLGEKILRYVFHDEGLLALVRHHHERYDGTGYPDALSCQGIPLATRVLSVADAYVAMTQERPYRPARSQEDAVREIKDGLGKQFCPQVVRAFLKVLAEPPAAVPQRRDSSSPAMAPPTAAAPAAPIEAPSPPGLSRAAAGKDLERRIKSIVELRALPGIVTDIVSMTSDDQTTDFAQLIAKVECDPALSAKVLRLANSALYGTSSTIESIDKAIVRIGAEGLRQLALGVILIDQWRESADTGSLSRGDFWRHSATTALLAKHTAIASRRCDGQTAFAAGLLHDIGQLILQEALGQAYARILTETRSGSLPLHQVEQEHLGTNHGEIMREVGRHWGLPRSLVEAIATHHQPWKQVQVAMADIQPLLICARMADSLADAMDQNQTGLGSLEAVPPVLIRLLGLEKRAICDLLPRVLREVSDLEQVYGLSSGTPAQLGHSDGQQGLPGCYFPEDSSAIDPIGLFLESAKVSFTTVATLEAGLRAAGEHWCWVQVATPAMARDILTRRAAMTPSATGASEARLFVLLPLAATIDLQNEFRQTGIRFLVEPWPTAALNEVLIQCTSISRQPSLV